MKEEMCNPISRATVHRIVHDELAMKKVLSQWVPKQLTETHQNECMASAIDFLTRYEQEGNAMLERIVTGDEMWVHHYTPLRKNRQWSGKSNDESAPKKFKAVKSAKKVMCTVF